MRGFLLRSLLTMLAVLVTAHVVPGIAVDGWVPALGAAIVLGLLNAVLRPLLLVLTCPFILLTFGLFIFVVNAVLLTLTSALIPGFYVAGFWSAVFGSIVISIISGVLNLLIGGTGRVEVAVRRHP
jgi:putative membrane protein